MALDVTKQREGQLDVVLKSTNATALDTATALEPGQTVPMVADVNTPVQSSLLYFRQFGSVSSMLATQETVWEGGGLYVYPTVGQIMNWQSDNIADTGQSIEICGIVAGSEVTETLTSDGTTAVPTVALFSRINSMTNLGPLTMTGTATLEGTTDAAVVFAQMGVDNRAEMAIYSTPTDARVWVEVLRLNAGSADEVEFSLMERGPGEPFRKSASAIVVGNTAVFQIARGNSLGEELPPGTDIEIRAIRLSGGGTQNVVANFALVRGPL